MRIALIPLDSRPPNWQFPQRLAEIGGIELLLPPRGLLGTLHRPADSLALLEWLGAVAPACDSAILAIDTFVYGGLVQSRKPGQLLGMLQLGHALHELRSSCPIYAYLCVPRLGTTVSDPESLEDHEALRRELARTDASSHYSESAWARDPLLAAALELRSRNQRVALELLAVADALSFTCLHFAVEDNATSGPHLKEKQELSAAAEELNHARLLDGRPVLPVSIFDGADECAGLLLARAAVDLQRTDRLSLHLSVHPASPGPGHYTGLYESHTLADGLEFLAGFLRFDYSSFDPVAQWLVCHGVQPQPDVFATEPLKCFNNPFLLPAEELLEASTLPLYVSDLAACNGFNPFLAARLERAGGRLQGLFGWNTNFNTLGSSAALISLARRAGKPDRRALRRFLLERLADDVVYQSIARPELLARCRAAGINPFDFGDLPEAQLQQLRLVVRRHWREWSDGAGRDILAALGIAPQAAALLQFDFPWQRAFEIEAVAPELMA